MLTTLKAHTELGLTGPTANQSAWPCSLTYPGNNYSGSLILSQAEMFKPYAFEDQKKQNY